tara:strand:+ start:484 stop:1128 length:645 start_codon:yes stop_codon:yes gene_type:complete
MDKQQQNQNKSQTSEILLKLEAIKINPTNPFTWSSGWKSPIYCDNRIILSDQKSRDLIANNFVEIIKKKYKEVDVIAGVATGAIGIGILIAQKLNLPFIYVRPQAKKHGRRNQIEGKVLENQKIVVIEDLVSTGKSSLNAVEALREFGLHIQGVIAIFTYGFEISEQNFKKAQVELNTLSDYSEIIEKALEINYITDQDLTILRKWNKSPENWG